MSVIGVFVLIACTACSTSTPRDMASWSRMAFETRLLILSENLYDEFDEVAFSGPLEKPPHPFRYAQTLTESQVELLCNATMASERSLILTMPRVAADDMGFAKVVFQVQTQFVVALSDLGPQKQWRLELEFECDPERAKQTKCANVTVDGRWVMAEFSDIWPGPDKVVQELWPAATRSVGAPSGEMWLIPLPDLPADAMRFIGDEKSRRGFLLLRPVLLYWQEHGDVL